MDRHRDRTDLEKESRKKTSLVATCDVIKGVVVERDHRDTTNVPLDKANYNTEHELLTECLMELAEEYNLVVTDDLGELIQELLERKCINQQQYIEFFNIVPAS